MNIKLLINNLLLWQLKNIKQDHFVIMLSIIIGLLGGIAAILAKNLVFYIHQFLTHGFNIQYENYLYMAYPLIGILLTVLFIKFFVKENIGHGISKVLYAFSRKSSKIESHNMYTSVISSSITGGFGGSVGLEAPIVLTGAAIGSNVGQLTRQNYKTTSLLIGCGVAGAIAAIFKAPITAVIFAIEILMLDLTTWSIIPLLISSVTGTTLAYFLMGADVVFSFTLKEPFVVRNFPFYILLGVLTGLVSVYFIRTNSFIEKKFNRVRNKYIKVALGGILLGLLIFIFPPLYGEGYESLKQILSGNAIDLMNNSYFYTFRSEFWVFMAFIVVIIVFKVIAMSITTGSGGIGGVFAPSLFIGGLSGFLFAKVINSIHFFKLSESNFSLVAMAGMISGVMAAPLTGVFLIAEITNGYDLFIPLIITSTIAYLTSIYFVKHSIYAYQLAEKGELLTHHKDKAVLTLLKLEKTIETDFKIVHPDDSLGKLVNNIAKSNRNIFPVIDSNDTFVGIVLLDHIRHIIFSPEHYENVYVKDLLVSPPTTISINENMEAVINKFEEFNAWNLPVVDNGKYKGFVSKSKILSAYRKMLVNFSDE